MSSNGVEKYYLPEDTQNALQNVRIDNFSLLINKFLCFDNGKFNYNSIETSKKIKDFFNKKRNTNSEIKHLLKNRNMMLRNAIEKSGVYYRARRFRLDWRFITGIGIDSVYETSITLHHILGIPFIPGQSVKGLVRNWMKVSLFNNNEESALQKSGFYHIFGMESSKNQIGNNGSVNFYDVLPVDLPVIDIDIMNPHYSQYYMGNQAPADYLNPEPIFFLTVKDTEFEFIFGIKKKDNYVFENGIFKGETPVMVAEKWLDKTLTEHGIGAKTAVGYGYMKSAGC